MKTKSDNHYASSIVEVLDQVHFENTVAQLRNTVGRIVKAVHAAQSSDNLRGLKVEIQNTILACKYRLYSPYQSSKKLEFETEFNAAVKQLETALGVLELKRGDLTRTYPADAKDIPDGFADNELISYLTDKAKKDYDGIERVTKALHGFSSKELMTAFNLMHDNEHYQILSNAPSDNVSKLHKMAQSTLGFKQSLRHFNSFKLTKIDNYEEKSPHKKEKFESAANLILDWAKALKEKK
jgi:hypothetical protein